MRPLKFRQPRLDDRGNFIDWFYWGFIDDGFIAPLRHDIDSYQFTGLKDKNSKEFYEDSIVHLQSQYETDEPIDCNVKVLFREGAFRLDFHNMLLNANIAASIGNWSTEIIGNIHQNPEILEQS